MVVDYSDKDLEDFARMLGIKLDDLDYKKPKKPNPNQKSIDAIGDMLRKYGGKK